MKIDDPYTTGTPIRDKRMCYGREEELAYLQDNLTRTTVRNLLVLYGQRRAGKTTLLYQLANSPALTPHVSVLVDLQSLTYGLTPGNFFLKIAHAIYKKLRSQGLCPPSLERAEFVGQTGVPADPQFAFDCFLDEVEPLLHERKLILLLDEFEVLEDQMNRGKLQPEIFEYLRSLMQRREYMHFLLSGTNHIEKLTREYWSVFFNIAAHYLLPSHITQAGAEALITEPVQGSLEYDPLAVAEIRRLTADQPYLIHLVCRSLVDHCNRQQKNYATLNDVNEVLSEVMEIGKIHFHWLWERIDPFAQILLLIIAGGSRDEARQFSFTEIIEIYQQQGIACSRDKLIDSLKQLLEKNVIEMDEGANQEDVFDDARYRVSIGLFRQWLRHRS
ncbi:MAG TPA: ATP-binding protein [Ktedonobacteraceae bacterium]|nr:ATP-binding protein [Ktedonobacteraceae bacterium]